MNRADSRRFPPRPLRSRVAALLGFFLTGALPLFPASPEPAGTEPLRFAFSSRMFTEVNENDAKASVKAWALAIARERGIAIDAQPIILGGQAEITEALKRKTIDGASVMSDEYLQLPPDLRAKHIFISYIRGQYTEEYLVLVRRESPVASLRDLAGQTLLLFENPRTSLARRWLDLALAAEKLPLAQRHFAGFVKATKLPRALLPVFFRQQAACLVTRRGFDTMCELNPQVRTQLRVIATSPALVPVVGFIRGDYDSPNRDLLLAALRNLEKSSAGTQVLTLFQSDQLHEIQPEFLEATRALFEEHERLLRASPSSPQP